VVCTCAKGGQLEAASSLLESMQDADLAVERSTVRSSAAAHGSR